MIIATIIQSNTIVPAYILTLLLLNLALEGNGDSISRLDVKTLLGNLLTFFPKKNSITLLMKNICFRQTKVCILVYHYRFDELKQCCSRIE